MKRRDTHANRGKSTAVFRRYLHIQNAFGFQIKQERTYYLAIHTARKLKMNSLPQRTVTEEILLCCQFKSSMKMEKHTLLTD